MSEKKQQAQEFVLFALKQYPWVDVDFEIRPDIVQQVNSG